MKLVATLASVCVLSSMSAHALDKGQLAAALTNPSANVPSVVSKYAKSSKDAAEVVTVAIQSTKASPALVSLIVQSAIKAKPSQTVAIVWAALGAAPGAYNEIKLAYLANAPKGANGEAPIWREVKPSASNPSDFPKPITGNGKGPTQGGPGGMPLIPVGGGVVIEVPTPMSPIK